MANESITQKRKKNANWEESEKNLLRECMKDVLHIIENKNTDTNTNKAKYLAWQKLMKSFNEINGRERNLNELKQQWRTIKMDAKKFNSQYKKLLKATGGGTKPPSPNPQMVEIIEMLPQEFEEDVNMFDSDTITQDSKLNGKGILLPVVPLQINKYIDNIEINEENIPNQESCPDENVIPEESATPTTAATSTSTFKRCKINTLESLRSSKRKKRTLGSEAVPEFESTLKRNTAVMKLMEAEHELKMKLMSEAHDWANEEHKLKCENLKLKNLLLRKQLSQ